MDSLAETQRRLWQLITAPDGVRQALCEEGDADGRSLSVLLRADAKGSAVDRLEIYANAYFYRIHDVLADDFPALRACLGHDAFHDLITAYLRENPPRHPSLRHAGDRLPGFASSAPRAAFFRRRCPWAGDLAAFEWALVEAFDAADAAELSRSELAAVPPENWEDLRFAFQPALQVLSLDWPVHRARSQWEEQQSVPDSLEPEAARVSVWRRREQVQHRLLEATEADALALVRGGGSFGGLCERLADRVGDEEAPGRAAALLTRWQGDGWLTGIGDSDQP
jgi:hypothetical protein